MSTSAPISSVDGYLQFMFAFQLGQISDFETLKRVMRRLIKKTKRQREFLLKAFESTYFDSSLIVKTVWVKSFQGAETARESDAEQYLTLARELANADETGFAMAAFESAAVIWDEYIQNPETAISCLEEAKSQLGENQAATRALSRILFHKHDYERQLAVGMPLSEEFIAGSTEASFFLRELAIANSRLGKHEAAKELFKKANRRIVDDPAKGITPMAAGLLADAAVEAHWTGNSAEAVRLFAQALEAADTLTDPDLLSGVIDAPPALAMEMADLIRFKTATLTAFGLQRNGVWGEETASQKIEHLGLMFGALAAHPRGPVRGYGVPPYHLTFGLLVFPSIWDWYVQ